jgi:hypothetical protein
MLAVAARIATLEPAEPTARVVATHIASVGATLVVNGSLDDPWQTCTTFAPLAALDGRFVDGGEAMRGGVPAHAEDSCYPTAATSEWVAARIFEVLTSRGRDLEACGWTTEPAPASPAASAEVNAATATHATPATLTVLYQRQVLDPNQVKAILAGCGCVDPVTFVDADSLFSRLPPHQPTPPCVDPRRTYFTVPELVTTARSALGEETASSCRIDTRCDILRRSADARELRYAAADEPGAWRSRLKSQDFARMCPRAADASPTATESLQKLSCAAKCDSRAMLCLVHALAPDGALTRALAGKTAPRSPLSPTKATIVAVAALDDILKLLDVVPAALGSFTQLADGVRRRYRQTRSE